MAAHRQRGTIRVRCGSWYGYFNTYEVDASTGEKKKIQRSVVIGPKSMGKIPAFRELAKHIDASHGTSSGSPVPDGSLTLEQFTRARWLPTRETKWRSYTDEKTGKVSNPGKDGADYILKHVFEGLGAVPLRELDSVRVQKWINKLAEDYSGSLVKHARHYVRSILEWAVWEDYLPKNPAKFLSLPATPPVKKHVLSPDQFLKVTKEMTDKDGLLVRLALFTAMRPAELLALQWCDFDPKERTFTIRNTVHKGVLRPYTKTTEEGEGNKSLLIVAVPDKLAQELSKIRGKVKDGHGTRQFSGEQDFIFASRRGTPRTREKVLLKVLKPVKEKLNLPKLNFQVLRRTMATLAQHSGSIKDIQAHLRHKSPDVTALEYVQEIPDSARSMVNSVYSSMMKKN